MTPDNPEPLSKAEITHYRSLAERGEIPPLPIIRRFIATIRKSFLAVPSAKQEKAKNRTAKPKVDENDIDFL
jgi:hypothetical protein